ncbi:MAG: hypothetical protein ACAI44_16870 [Candidatus Sericytochromatia bacterium]
MTLSSLQNGQSYQVRQVSMDGPDAREKLVKSLEKNGKADLVLGDASGTLVVSGDKIDLRELGKAAPEIPLWQIDDLKRHDGNQDGCIEESELRLSGGDAWDAAMDRHEREVKDSASRMGGNGDFIAASGALIFGYTLGLLEVPVYRITMAGDYKTDNWNDSRLVKTAR